MARLFGSSVRSFSLLPLTFAMLGACSRTDLPNNTPQSPVNTVAGSSVNTVNLPHTPVKWQSIGNCWAYAAMGWVEAMMLRDAEATPMNFSETYVTYRHYELQLSDRSIDELQTGGSFQEAAEISIRFGLMKEGDFAPDEANTTKSERQKRATNYLNESLKSGQLSRSRTAAVIRAELDAAFGVQLEKLADKIIPASSILVPAGRGATAPLDQVMLSWREVRWPISYNEYPYDGGDKAAPQWSGKITEPQVRLMRRVMRAMNAKYPVVVNWFVDFRAMNNAGVFDLKTLKQSQATARQGFHSTVLEDYIAEGANPQTGVPFETPEGEVPDEIKNLAAQYGTIKALITKNSWGGSERFDRASYQRDGEKGYHKLGVDYMLAFLPQFDEKSNEFQGYTTGVNSFILPPGF